MRSPIEQRSASDQFNISLGSIEHDVSALHDSFGRGFTGMAEEEEDEDDRDDDGDEDSEIAAERSSDAMDVDQGVGMRLFHSLRDEQIVMLC